MTAISFEGIITAYRINADTISFVEDEIEDKTVNKVISFDVVVQGNSIGLNNFLNNKKALEKLSFTINY